MGFALGVPGFGIVPGGELPQKDAPALVNDVLAQIKLVELIEKGVILTPHYAGCYAAHPPDGLGYLFTCLREDGNIEAIVSVNEGARIDVEITRLTGFGIMVHYQGRLICTMPVEESHNKLTPGYISFAA